MLEHIFSLWGFLTVGAVCWGVIGLAETIAKAWRKARVAELDASLKAEMIKQGRSADEIERVLLAGTRAGKED